jgi:hypothetical protein
MQDSTPIEIFGQCKVCRGADINFVFNTKILGQYPAHLLECAACGFQYFHDARIWLGEAYTTPIANTDTGIVRRSLNIHRVISSFLSISNARGEVLDWGSGSGLLVRLLRDDGHDCYGFEPFTVPVLAAGHTYKEEKAVLAEHSYRAIVAIEVVEHLVDPAVFFQKALAHTDTLMFSTELVDRAKNGNDWWYYSSETGQHISFYTEKSLAHLATIYGCIYASDRRKSLHIMTRKSLDIRLFKWIAGYRRALLTYPVSRGFKRIAGRASLLMPDHLAAKEVLRSFQLSNSL